MPLVFEKGTVFFQGKFQQLGNLVVESGKIADISLTSGKIKKQKAGKTKEDKGNGHDSQDSAANESSIVDCEGKFVLPGFIDSHTHLGLEEDGIGWIDADLNESFGLVTPQVRAYDAIKMRDRAFKDALSGGITTVMITPGSTNPIGGQTCVVKARGNTIEDASIKEFSGIKLAFGENPKRTYAELKQFPSTRMGTAAVIREWLMKAQDYLKKKKGKDFKEREIKLEALIPLIEGKIQARAHAHLADDIITAYRIGQEFNLDLVIDHCTEGHLIAKELGRWKAKAVVGPTLSTRDKPELRHKTFDTVRILLDEGCIVALTTDHPVIPIEALSIAAAMCVRHGLDEERAIKAISEYPAIILGMDKKIGKIDVGLDGDLVIWSGHPLDARSKVEAVYIEGVKVL
ncbi:MAG: amidohydrolase family protein [Candidatus Riflebacteria bacterium]|nr:amidohydrolase family protein [Candidatus Riflebacteria bacterium]